jgi:hypothetical protein
MGWRLEILRLKARGKGFRLGIQKDSGLETGRPKETKMERRWQMGLGKG